MAVSHVGAGATFVNKATTSSFTISTGAVAAGQLVLLRIGAKLASTTASTVTATGGGGTWTLLGSSTVAAGAHTYVLASVIPTAGTFTVTVTFGTAPSVVVAGTEIFAGAAITTDGSSTGGSAAGSGSLSTSSFTTTTAGDLLVTSVARAAATATMTGQPTSWAALPVVSSTGGSGSSNVDLQGGYLAPQAAAGSVAWTGSTGANTALYSAVTVALKAGSTGPFVTQAAAVSGSGTLTATTSVAAGRASIRTLTETFATQDTTKWTGWATGVAATGGQLSITPTGAYPGITSTGLFDARDAITSVELPQAPNIGNGSTSAWLVLLPSGTGAGLRMGEEGGTLYAEWRAPGAGSWTIYASTTFNATAHKIWRIRESGKQLYYETSSNGISWSVLYGPIATPVDVSAVQVNLQSGFWGTEPTPGAALFDNVNATYADPPPTPRTFYVDPAGVDTADGLSTTTPWKTIAKLNGTSMYPGDVVLLKRGGTWAEALTVSGSGSSTAPITYGAYGTGAQPIIDGGGASGTAGVRKPVEVYGSFVVVQDIEVRGSIGNDILINGPDCTVQRCTIRWGAYGITQGNLGARVQILNNTIINVNYLITGTTNNDDTGAMGLLLQGDSAVVTGNTISGCWSTSPDYGIDGSAIDVYQGTNAQIYGNKASECVTFLELGDPATKNITAHHNTFTSTLTIASGLTVHGAAPFGPVTGTKFHHNTVVLTGGTAQCTGVWMDAGTTMDVRNNILVATGSGKPIYAEAAITEAGNVLFGGSYTLTGQSLDATSTIADPHFLAPYTDLHIYTDSPAVDRGVNLGYVTDLDGVAPTGTVMDSGAYEAVTAPSATASAALAGVGTLAASSTPAQTYPLTLSGAGTLTATVAVTSTQAAAVSGAGTLTASAAAAGTRAAALSGSGTLTVTTASAQTAASPLSGSGSLAATTATTQAAQLAGSGALTATTAPGLTAAAAASGIGTLAATAAPALTASASLAAPGALSATTSIAAAVSVTLAGSGTLTASGLPAASRTATLTGSGVLAATGAATVTQAAAVTGSGALTATTGSSLTVSATLGGAGTLSGAAAANGAVAVGFTGSGTLAATGTSSLTAAAGVTGSGALTATGTPARTATATPSGTGTLAATGGSALTVGVTLSGSGTLTATTASGGVTNAALSGSGTLTATATGSVQVSVNAPLTATGTLTATTATALNAAANLAATGTLTAITAGTLTLTAAFSGTGALTATATGGGRDITLTVGTPTARTLRAGPLRARTLAGLLEI